MTGHRYISPCSSTAVLLNRRTHLNCKPPVFGSRTNLKVKNSSSAFMPKGSETSSGSSIQRALQSKIWPDARVDDIKLKKEEKLATLWAGYGSISSLVAQNAQERVQRSFIVKRVSPPGGSGISHERKMHSYQVEAFFYSHLAAELAAGGGCPVPVPLMVESTLTSAGGTMTLLMSDLRPDFPLRKGSYSLREAKVVLSWLAAFHAAFWERPRPSGVWEQGTYWYLDTRPDEFEQIDADWKDLKRAARSLDRALKGFEGEDALVASPRYRTLVHGDCKSENVLFSGDGKRCAMYDFQYVGEGYGARDIAYLLCSSVARGVVQASERELLDHYHSELALCLGPARLGDYTVDVLQRHFDIALADLVRFLAGWGMWGSNVSWAAARARTVVADLLR